MKDFWLIAGRVVDGTGADPLDGIGIHVENGTITALGSPPAGADTIDASDLTITPGLIDAHVHIGLSSDISASIRYELSVAELAADMFNNCSNTLDGGFTTVRDTGGIDAGVAGVVAAGKIRGPRILQCGPIHCQTGGHGYLAADWEPTAFWCHHDIPGLRGVSLLSDSPDELRRNVREGFRRGADFIKLAVTGGVVSKHDKLSDTQFTVEEIKAAVAEASARGTYVTVHAHNNAGVRNAVEAGVKCIEHGTQIDEATAALMAANDVAHVPTLAVVQALSANASGVGLSPTMSERIGAVMQGQIDALKASRAAGVKVGLGSDLIGPHQLGRGEELRLRSECETPLLALESATKINAEILGIAAQVGTIEVGKVADLVGFSSDPIDDPTVFADRNRVVLVLQSGRVVKDQRT